MALLTGWFDKNTDANDDPLSGALVYVYLPGTTTPVSVFSDEEMTVPAANPIVCDSAGVLPIRYVAVGTYKIRVTTSAGAEVRTTDDFEVGGAGGTVTLTNYGKPRSLALLEAFDSSVTAVQTTGYATSGDGGAALYKRVGSEPNHSGKFQDGNDDWWEYADIEGGVNVRALSDDDDAAFAAAKSIAENYSGWRSGYQINPTVLDLGGRVFTLTAPVWFQTSVSIKHGKIVFTDDALTGSDYGIRVGNVGSSGTSFSPVFENVEFSVINDAGEVQIEQNHSAALLEVPRCFGARFFNCKFNVGLGEFRTRYGLFVGADKGWGLSIDGGRYAGGECPLRIGRSSDHVGFSVRAEVIEHGRLCNVMLCNPQAASLTGNIEQPDGPFNVVITAATSTAGEPAGNDTSRGVRIGEAYLFNNAANGTWDFDQATVLAGYDVPGTEGWDGVGVISSASVTNLEIANSVIINVKHAKAIKADSFVGLKIDNVSYEVRGRIGFTSASGTFSGGETVTGGTSGATCVVGFVGADYFLTAYVTGKFSSGETITGGTSGVTATLDASNTEHPALLSVTGPGDEVNIARIREVETGSTLPNVITDATNPVGLCRRPRSFVPTLLLNGSLATYTPSAASGRYWIENGVAYAKGEITWASGSGSGSNVRISLPDVFDYANGSAPCALRAYGFSGAVEGERFGSPTNSIALYAANSSSAITTIPASGRVSFEIAVPLTYGEAP